MSANKEINPSVIALVEFLKGNPDQPFTFAEMADGAGVARATGFIRGVKAILGDNLVVDKADMPVTKTVGAYSYVENEEYKPSEKSNPSDNSKAVADYFVANPGKEFTLADLSEALGFKVLSGHLSGARAILGKANIVRSEVEIAASELKTVYIYHE